MLKVVIVDDEITVIETLKKMLTRYAGEQGIEIAVDYYQSPVNFLTEYTNRYDLVALDIEMPDMNGMTAARKLREMDNEVSLIFVTNMRQYAINGYEVNATDFIIKPVSYYDFALKLNRILKKMRSKNTEVVSVKVDGVLKYLPMDDIRYLEAGYNHKLLYHTADDTYEGWGTIKKIEPAFLSNNFLRCNNYCLVNPRYVLGVEGNDVRISPSGKLQREERVSISRSRKKEFMLLLNKYLGVTT